MPIDRRAFLAYGSAACAALISGAGLSGCGEDAEGRHRYFRDGVASGDPTKEGVVLWTRYTPQNDGMASTVEVKYEIAQDTDFRHLVRKGSVQTDRSHDFTVHADVGGLEAGKTYFYRFRVYESYSETGRTRTLPVKSETVKLAFFSCANYTNGYFNAYDYAARFDDLDAVIHLGDYIYEYGMVDADGKPAYATERAEVIGRVLPEDNDSELLSLSDYRKRYALYRCDPMLRTLHRLFPFICIWDDHEIADNAWTDGAENHSETAEGDYSKRKRNAMQAYFEWLPIRPVQRDGKATIYRAFEFGDLLSLHMLDTRHEGRSKQAGLSAEDLNDSEAFRKTLASKQGKLMSDAQWNWLNDSLQSAKSRWTVIAQQVIVEKLELPVELAAILMQLMDGDLSDDEKEALITEAEQIANELASIKKKQVLHDPSLTEEEKARLQDTVPYNLDAWDGYPGERERLYALLLGRKNCMIFSGDSHNAWCNLLRDDGGARVAVEIGVPSVSSPGIESYLGLTDRARIDRMEQGVRMFNPETVYDNLSDRGLVIAEFSQDRADIHWIYVDSIDSDRYERLDARCKTLAFAAS